MVVSTPASLPKHVLNAKIFKPFHLPVLFGILFWYLVLHPEQETQETEILSHSHKPMQKLWPFRIFLESLLCIVVTRRFQNGIKNLLPAGANTTQLLSQAIQAFLGEFWKCMFHMGTTSS